MYLLRVAPIGKGIFKEDLHYFTQEQMPLGAVVSILVRKKLIHGLVLERTDVADEKTAIKSYPYKIRRIEDIKAKAFFLPEFMEVVYDLAKYYAGTLGQTISQVVPHEILKEATALSGIISSKTTVKKENGARALRWEGPLVLQGSDEERLLFYKSRIREAFARDMSVLICLPSITDIDRFAESFEKGIEKYIIPLHGRLSKRALLSNWKKALTEDHPVLIIATGQFLCIPRKDIGTIILDKESSPLYKTLSRPFVDFRKAATLYAKKSRISFVLGDMALRTETIYEKESSNCHPASNVKYHILSRAKVSLIDMTQYRDAKPYTMLSEEFIEFVDASIKKKERVFIFSHRKGLATFTVCDDCGETLICDKCNSPLALHRKKATDLHRRIFEKDTIFVCNKCRNMYPSTTACKKCGGWRMSSLGIGIDKVGDALNRLFPKTKIFKIDGETIKGYKEGREVAKKFISSPGSICVGTEMSFFYLNEKFENTAVASIDSFFALPGFRIKERALNILMRIKMMAQKKMLIQTRNPSWPLFTYVKSGDLINFYREEVAERSKLKYPPLYTLIKITLEGDSEIIIRNLEKLKKRISGHITAVYPAFTSRVRGKDRAHLLIKIKRGLWPDEKVLGVLKSLPPQFIINVDPSDLL